jgi:site-specific DNA recombinase
MRAALYGRYSSEGQRDASIEDQFRNCETRAEKEGWQIVARYEDKGVSGTQDEKGRDGYAAMLKAAKARQFSVLLVDDLSRLSRDEAELILTRRKLLFWGVRLIGVSDGYDSDAKGHKIQATMRGLMNDIFLDDLKAKTHRGMSGQALKGYSTGSRVYGYRRVPIEDPTKTDDWGRSAIVAVKREIDEDKAQWVRQMFQWYADGRSLRWICSELNRLHVPTPGAQDRRKHPSTIAGLWFARRLAGGSATFTGILENSTYIGRVVWNRREWLTDPETKRKHARLRPDTEWITTEHAVEPIVSLPLWQAVRRGCRACAATPRGRRGGAGRSSCCPASCGVARVIGASSCGTPPATGARPIASKAVPTACSWRARWSRRRSSRASVATCFARRGSSASFRKRRAYCGSGNGRRVPIGRRRSWRRWSTKSPTS